MKVLIFGGTGTISSGITKACLAAGFEVVHFNRGHHRPPEGVTSLQGDRYNLEDLRRAAASQADVVIDMLGFSGADAQLVVDAFAAKTQQLIFCSTACVYEIRLNAGFYQESDALASHWHYGAGKAEAEAVLSGAAEQGAFQLTIFRPAHVYNAASSLHQLGLEPNLLIRRIAAEQAVALLDGGRALWQACHADDAGLAFALACLNSRCYSQAYNLSAGGAFPWRGYYETIGQLIGKSPRLVTINSNLLMHQPYKDDPQLDFARNISRFNFTVDISKLLRHLPNYRAKVTLSEGLSQALAAVADLGKPFDYPELIARLLESSSQPMDES